MCYYLGQVEAAAGLDKFQERNTVRASDLQWRDLRILTSVQAVCHFSWKVSADSCDASFSAWSADSCSSMPVPFVCSCWTSLCSEAKLICLCKHGGARMSHVRHGIWTGQGYLSKIRSGSELGWSLFDIRVFPGQQT